MCVVPGPSVSAHVMCVVPGPSVSTQAMCVVLGPSVSTHAMCVVPSLDATAFPLPWQLSAVLLVAYFGLLGRQD
jgi:hypothetical protein